MAVASAPTSRCHHSSSGSSCGRSAHAAARRPVAAAARAPPLRARVLAWGARLAAAGREPSAPAAVPAAHPQPQQQPQQPQQQPQQPEPPPLRAYLDFELLWTRARAGMSIGREAAGWALDDARRGAAPCDCAELEARVCAWLELGRALPGLDARRVVNSHRLALRLHPREISVRARMLIRLLPDHPPTPLLLAALSELPHRPPEALALAVSSLAPAARAALGSAAAGPLLAALLAAADGGGGAGGSPDDARARLGGIAAVLGPELAHGALAAAPQLISVPPSDLAARVAALGALLQRPPVEAALLAARHGALLAAPPARVEAAGEQLVGGLAKWLGWPRQRALHFLAWNPGVLTAAVLAGPEGGGGKLPAVELMGSGWAAVAKAAKRRPRWRGSLGRRRYPLVAAALCGPDGGAAAATAAAAADACLGGGGGGGGGGAALEAAALEAWADAQQQRLQRLRYCAETGDLPKMGLRRLLLLSGVEFATKCPRYRAWRLKRAATAEVRGRGGRGGVQGVGEHGGAGELPALWPDAQLEVLGALGRYDRL
ncbi:hypothetical protein Rsub_02535 [Raphidocelis subcapitata]|uniref:Uncharacterized protein n=1 Tax=Raphidocelis subcapitata TaxID=307507 RepID=A0A2V0NQD0_9CHLO|nr:hypothetical protein Rsub_02535 [Raphidocelis subcapitata]|eukprot:GBF89831.1 hypothetical protein Rsub_02535 [Raphidocelis subcapitata]